MLGLPAVAMGATVPVMMAALAPTSAGFSRALGALYGINTAGAVAGVLLAELWLIPALGIRGSAFAACFACGVLGLSALGLARRSTFAAPIELSTSRSIAPSIVDLRMLLLASGLAGFALLGLEVVWFRFLSLVLNDTPLAFAVMLASVLIGIALGGALAGLASKKLKTTASLVSAVAFLTGALGLVSYRVYSGLVQQAFSFDQGAWTVLRVAAPLVLPTAIASGALYAWTGGLVRRAALSMGSLNADAEATGKLAFANTLGAALGALAGGLVLLPNAGIERALIGLCVSYGAAGLLLAIAEPNVTATETPRSAWLARAGAPIALLLALISFPFGDVRARFITASAERWMGSEDKIVKVVEARSATMIHVEHRAAGLRVFDQIATNAYSMTVDDFAARRYMKLFAYIPTMLHPKIERTLVIGYGLGSTAQAILDNPDVARLDVVDTEPKMVALASQIMRDKGPRDPMADPRVKLHIDDGRHFVQLASASGQAGYDLITGEPPPPIVAGVAHLYTREYFQLLYGALREGGMVTYWLPLMNLSAASSRAVMHAFCDAFPTCSLWHGSGKNFMLLGEKRTTKKERVPVSLDRYTRIFRIGALRPELKSIGFDTHSQIGTLFIADRPWLEAQYANMPALTDDFPRRLGIKGKPEQREALIWRFRDTAAARKRFKDSALIKSLFPDPVRIEAGRRFEDQRLYTDLILDPNTAARQVGVLSTVLEHTPITLSALLLLNSDPDIQRALRQLGPSQLQRPELMPHRLAGALAARDFKAASWLIKDMRDDQLPMPGLREYIDGALIRMSD
jgi:spermidine synthase